MVANARDIYGEPPSATYRLYQDSACGRTDGLEAMEQAVYLILNTQRYEYPIYSWNYGMELDGLFGKPLWLVRAELEGRVAEALLQDTRILAVDGFEFEARKGGVEVRFIVHTVFGDFASGKIVEI